MLTANNALVRLYASCSVLTTVGIAAVDPSSRHFEALRPDGMVGRGLIILMAVMALCGILDVVINDWFPKMIKWRFPHKNRHMIYMGMSLAMVCMLYSVTKSDAIGPFIARYVVDAVFATYIACKGVQSHYREKVRA